MSATESRQIWSDETHACYLDWEAASLDSGGLGPIPKDAATEINRVCKLENIDFQAGRRITNIGYPVLGVVHQIGHLCRGDAGNWCHWGATTQDVTDSATVFQIRASFDIIANKLDEAIAATANLARDHRDLPMAGRSNLQHAVPITFGFKMARLLATFLRHRDRLKEIRPRIEVFEFGGACGTLASLGEKGLAVQEALARELGLSSARHCLAHGARSYRRGRVFSGSPDRHARKVRDRPEVDDANGGRRSQRAVRRQPRLLFDYAAKRNPISCVYITACAASVRQSVAALLTAMDEDHERATGPWEIEWITLPSIFTLAAGALNQAVFVLKGLEVHPDRMRANLGATHGLIVSEAVMMGLAPALGRDEAHDLVYDLCRKSLEEDRPLADLLAERQTVMAHLSRDEIQALTDPANYLGLAGVMTDKVLAFASHSASRSVLRR